MIGHVEGGDRSLIQSDDATGGEHSMMIALMRMMMVEIVHVCLGIHVHHPTHGRSILLTSACHRCHMRTVCILTPFSFSDSIPHSSVWMAHPIFCP